MKLLRLGDTWGAMTSLRGSHRSSSTSTNRCVYMSGLDLGIALAALTLAEAAFKALRFIRNLQQQYRDMYAKLDRFVSELDTWGMSHSSFTVG